MDRCTKEGGERRRLVAEIYSAGQAKHLVENQLPEGNEIVGIRTNERQWAQGDAACQAGWTLGKSLRFPQQRDRSRGLSSCSQHKLEGKGIFCHPGEQKPVRPSLPHT